MSKNVKSVLSVKATAKLQADIEKELLLPDPEIKSLEEDEETIDEDAE